MHARTKSERACGPRCVQSARIGKKRNGHCRCLGVKIAAILISGGKKGQISMPKYAKVGYFGPYLWPSTHLPLCSPRSWVTSSPISFMARIVLVFSHKLLITFRKAQHWASATPLPMSNQKSFFRTENCHKQAGRTPSSRPATGGKVAASSKQGVGNSDCVLALLTVPYELLHS